MGNMSILSTQTPVPGTWLTFVEEAPRSHPRRRRATFICKCGTLVDSDVNYVRFLNVTSCGCRRAELTTIKNTKHGNAGRETKTGAYRSWQAMHQRCAVGRGVYASVSVCSEWSGASGFANFLASMGSRPNGYTLERLNGNLGYAPSNCIWASRMQQAHNLSTNVDVSIGGKTQCIAEWCREFGIDYAIVKQRRKRGIGIVEAIITPITSNKSHKRKQSI